ncbi:MAG: hypothetical protein ABI691_16320 [Ginsengibacter sp.]
MKQAVKTTKMVTMGLFTLCTMGLSHATYAGVTTESPIEFKFVGKVNSSPVFQLNLHNDASEVYYIHIKDASNNVLYSEKVKATDANYTRKYRLDIDPADLSAYGFGVKVEVTSAKTHKTQVYKISSQTTVKEDIIVAQL